MWSQPLDHTRDPLGLLKSSESGIWSSLCMENASYIASPLAAPISPYTHHMMGPRKCAINVYNWLNYHMWPYVTKLPKTIIWSKGATPELTSPAKRTGTSIIYTRSQKSNAIEIPNMLINLVYWTWEIYLFSYAGRYQIQLFQSISVPQIKGQTPQPPNLNNSLTSFCHQHGTILHLTSSSVNSSMRPCC